MAIEIIKQGQTKFTAYCYKCGCEFTYELEDLDAAGCVKCPCCENYIVHTKNKGIINYSYGAIPCVDDHSNLNTQVTSMSKKCEDCDFYKKYLAGGKTYIGDLPCQWCSCSPYIVSCSIATTKFEK